MSMPQWRRVALVAGAWAGLAAGLGCASSGSTAEGERVPRERPSPGNRITRADIEAAQGMDIATLIETRLAGVSVLRQGNDYVVRIRGVSSFMSSTDALVLVDGVETSLGSVALNDIHSIEVLKDAAAAIYGVRGANGVLLIRTQR